MSDGISVGDAVLRFVGETTQLDQTFASLPGKAQAGLAPVQQELDEVTEGFNKAGAAGEVALGEEIPVAAELTRKQISEARGEVRLLGEEFGVRLPRHVASFVAELPLVGEAMSAAFAATAIFILIKALNDATNKLADMLYGLKDGAEFSKKWNSEMEKSSGHAKNAAQALLDYGKSADDLARDKIANLVAQMNEQNRRMVEAHDALLIAAKGSDDYKEAQLALNVATREASAATDEYKRAVKELHDEEKKDENSKKLKGLQEVISLTQKLTEVQIIQAQINGADQGTAEELRYQAQLKSMKALAAAEVRFGTESVIEHQKTNADIEKFEQQHALKMKELADKEAKDLEKTFAEMQKEIGSNTVGALQAITAGLPPVVAGLLKMRQAAQLVGVTLRSDLVKNLNAAELAKNEFVNTMGTKDVAQIHAFDTAIHKAQLALKHFNDEAKKGKSLILQDRDAMEEFKTTATAAAQSLGQGVSKAFSDMIDHQGSFGKAMTEATFKMIAQMAEQWGAYYIALGMADLFAPGGQAIGAGEIAAGLGLEALGGVLGGLGSRGSGGSNNASTTQAQSSSVDTGGSTRSTIGVTGVQKFAMGGLISAPTLAVIGENPGESEAVLPLDNPKSMAKIGKSISDNGGGGSRDIHVHVKGLVSPDNLNKVISQINRKVGQGRANLKASDSFRVTKRSA
jgi:hypothetical protein